MLRDYFGDERRAIEFMRAFAGVQLRIPTMPVVEKLARDRQIVATLSRNPDTATVRRLSQLQGIPMRSVAKSYARQVGHGLTHVRQIRGLPFR